MCGNTHFTYDKTDTVFDADCTVHASDVDLSTSKINCHRQKVSKTKRDSNVDKIVQLQISSSILKGAIWHILFIYENFITV